MKKINDSSKELLHQRANKYATRDNIKNNENDNPIPAITNPQNLLLG